MRIILQNALTLTFYRNDGTWVEDASEAMTFDSCLTALQLCQKEDYRNVTILLEFDNEEYNFGLALK